MTDIRRITGKDCNFTSQAAPSAAPKESFHNVETELVQQALKKHLNGVSSATVTLGASRLIL
jgi:hypothetical protein